jgi:Lar family restriction alleviation protein
MVELKPCPFCGGEAEINDIGDRTYGSCLECCARSEWYWRTEDKNLTRAIRAWNTRQTGGENETL